MDGVFRRSTAGAAGGEGSATDRASRTELESRRGGRGGGKPWSCLSTGAVGVAMLTLLVALVVVSNMYMTLSHKLAAREQEALSDILELDELKKKVKQMDEDSKRSTMDCKVRVEQMEQDKMQLQQKLSQVQQQLQEAEDKLKLADEMLLQLQGKHDIKLNEWSNAIADIEHLNHRLADQETSLAACLASHDTSKSTKLNALIGPSSTHPTGFRWPATTMQKRKPRRVAIVIPHALYQENRLSEFYARNLPYIKYRDLYIYTNKLYGGDVETDRRKMEEYKQNMMRTNMYSCYGSVNFISANLTEEEDPYPFPPGTGRNNSIIAHLFFKIFEMDVFRQNYDYAFIMESDVRPIRPFWLDNIYEHAEYAMEDFWIKGSLYRGLADPKDYCSGVYWGCADHFNGNSMFKLGDPIFDSFLRFARDTRISPGKTTGMNHDAQLVRVLRDPSVWKFYQRYAHKFVYTEFIQHRQPLIISSTLAVFPNTYIVHQVVDVPEEPQEGHADEIYLDRANITLRFG